MSKGRRVRCCVQKIKRHTKYVFDFKQSYSVFKKSLIIDGGGVLFESELSGNKTL